MTAVTLVPVRRVVVPGVGSFVVTTAPVVLLGAVVLFIQLCSSAQQARGGFVGWEPHSGRKQSCYLFTLPLGANAFEPVCGVGVWCKLSAY